MSNQNRIDKIQKEKNNEEVKKEKDNIIRHLKGLLNALQALLAKEHPDKRE